MGKDDLKKILEEIALLRQEVKELSDRCHQFYWGIAAGIGGMIVAYFFK